MRVLTAVLAAPVIAFLLPPLFWISKALIAVELCDFTLPASQWRICQPKDVDPMKFGTFIQSQANLTDIASLVVSREESIAQSNFESSHLAELDASISRSVSNFSMVYADLTRSPVTNLLLVRVIRHSSFVLSPFVLL